MNVNDLIVVKPNAQPGKLLNGLPLDNGVEALKGKIWSIIAIEIFDNRIRYLVRTAGMWQWAWLLESDLELVYESD